MSSKNKITAILVDDEPKALRNLSYLLEKHCPEIEILTTANLVDVAVKAIAKYQPDVVFLDIEMPGKSGFELFEATKEVFQTIFVTAYDTYAIKAFEVSAVDYLLKPIKVDRLKESVGRIKKVSMEDQQSINSLHQNLKSHQITQVVVKQNKEYKVIETENIICIKANQAYSIIYHIEDKQVVQHIYAKNLTYFDRLFENDHRFFRTHRSWMINLGKVSSFSKSETTIHLWNDLSIEIAKGKIQDFEKQLTRITK